MNKNAPRENFKGSSNHNFFGGQMKRVILFSIIAIVLLSSTALAMENARPSNIKHNRIIARTNSLKDRESFKLEGCKIIHELRDATALDCPDNVKIQNSEPDTVLHIMDLGADQQIKADQVWTSYTGSDVTVAVLDTGIDYTHLQLNSSSGSIDPTNGHCFAVTGGDCGNGFFDDNGHGTHVSGIITSDGLTDSNNGTFSKGVAPGANIWMAKVCDGGGNCYISDIADAIQYVVNNHIAKVMSISIGGGVNTGANCDSDYLASQINWAYDNGVVAVIAAGNSGSAGVSSPACASKAIAVAAVDSSDNLAYFSNYGNALKDHGVAAPGVSIFSSLPGNTYAYWSGTSMATPHVSAVIALMLSKNPSLSPADIRSTIFSSADCLNNKYGTCSNIYIGYGIVDALKAVSPAPSSYLSLSAIPSAMTTAQSSTITASTSDIKSGVTISFSTSLGSIPASCTSDSTGECSVTFSSSTAGTATITGSATGYTSGSTSVTVTSATYTVTFSKSGIPSGRTWGVTVGTTRYTSTTSSVSVSGLSGTASYTYDSVVSGTTGTRYACGTGCSGSITSTDSNKAATYKTQYQLTIMPSPASYGTTYPATGSWYDSGSAVRIIATPNAGYAFSTWYGSGIGSYSGRSNPVTIAMKAPITQTARFTASRQYIFR